MQVSRIRSLRPNILVVDLASFGADGQGMLNAIRPRLVEVPTILLLAKGHAGARVGGEMCIKEVWKTDFLDDTRTLDVHVCWLRLKIEDDPSAP